MLLIMLTEAPQRSLVRNNIERDTYTIDITRYIYIYIYIYIYGATSFSIRIKVEMMSIVSVSLVLLFFMGNVFS